MLLACSLALQGFRILFKPVQRGGRPFTARRGNLIIHARPGVAPRIEVVTPQRFTVSN